MFLFYYPAELASVGAIFFPSESPADMPGELPALRMLPDQLSLDILPGCKIAAIFNAGSKEKKKRINAKQIDLNENCR